jgi:para-aminobenzoate synthetase component 1
MHPLKPQLKHQLQYPATSTALFARISHKPWAIMLDSGQPHNQYGRYDILVAEPFVTLRNIENSKSDPAKTQTEIFKDGQLSISHEDPFALLNNLLAPYQAAASGLPFSGGAVGYFAYDLLRQLERLPAHNAVDAAIPHMLVGIYDWCVLVDHHEKTACLVSHGFEQKTHDRWAELCALFDAPAAAENSSFHISTAISSNMDFSQYAQAFNKVKDYITAGDCYQVNLAQRFSAQAQGNSWPAYLKLREISPAPFMAFMNFGDLQVVSGSPERFLQVVSGVVETRPIKGTRPRSADTVQDRQYADELQASVKDKAENLMIVDLLRNDISKSCAVGTVKADQLFQLQSFANVHHLVSIVRGVLQPAKTALDLLRGCFPGGSITGAPKLRAVEIIEELEPHRRGVYCGAIGYIGFDGNMDTNIAIRTAVYAAGEISFCAGGGIVADSILENEYAETLDKAASLLNTMQFFQQHD